MFNNINNQAANFFVTDKNAEADQVNFKPVKDNTGEDNSGQAGNNAYSEGDSASIDPNNTKSSKNPPTVVDFDKQSKTAENHLNSHEELTADDIKIIEFIAKINNETWDCVIKSFDQMLQNARKMMEENQKIIKEKIIPQKEALKQEIAKTEIQKEITMEKNQV